VHEEALPCLLGHPFQHHWILALKHRYGGGGGGGGDDDDDDDDGDRDDDDDHDDDDDDHDDDDDDNDPRSSPLMTLLLCMRKRCHASSAILSSTTGSSVSSVGVGPLLAATDNCFARSLQSIRNPDKKNKKFFPDIKASVLIEGLGS
jgi:hypothetical protein